MFPKQLSSYIEKERHFRHLCVAKCLLRKSLAAGALCRHTSDVLLRFPHLEECPARDYFSKVEASLPEEIPRQGLFFRAESIPARRNAPLGIIFPRRKHPCQKKSTVRDYFPEAKASLLEEFHRLGLFSRGESISARRIPPSGIIFPRQMHPCSEKSPVRDYFPEAKASLLEEIHRQGLFSRGGCIPAQRNPFSGIIFLRQKHPCYEVTIVKRRFQEISVSVQATFVFL